jgi:hypothetical protein
VGCGESLNRFEGQSQGAQALDHLHASHRFFPKQAVVALAAARGGEEPQVLVGAQALIGTPVRRESCPTVIACDRNIFFSLSSLTEGLSLVRSVAAFDQTM